MSQEDRPIFEGMGADTVASIEAGEVLEQIDAMIMRLLEKNEPEKVKIIIAMMFDKLASHKKEVVELVDRYAQM